MSDETLAEVRVAAAVATSSCGGCGALGVKDIITAEFARGTFRGHRRRDVEEAFDYTTGEMFRRGTGEWVTCGPITEITLPEETLSARRLREAHHRREHVFQSAEGCPPCVAVSQAIALARGERPPM